MRGLPHRCTPNSNSPDKKERNSQLSLLLVLLPVLFLVVGLLAQCAFCRWGKSVDFSRIIVFCSFAGIFFAGVPAFWVLYFNLGEFGLGWPLFIFLFALLSFGFTVLFSWGVLQVRKKKKILNFLDRIPS